MLFAERHGKLGRDGSRAHDRAEDLLTSTAFQLLRYLPPEVGLLAVLKRVRTVRRDGVQVVVHRERPSWLNVLDHATGVTLEFWPNWGKGVGQPEVVVAFHAEGKEIGRMLVEVKLDSGKSQLAPGEPEQPELAIDPRPTDQLFRYWTRLAELNAASGFPPGGLVYLTAHATPPLDDLTESLLQQPAAARCDWLGWLSWRDVWAEMRAAAKHHLPAEDLAAILAAKGLNGFDGFRSRAWASSGLPSRFWRPRAARWFAQPLRALPPAGRFWTSTRGAS